MRKGDLAFFYHSSCPRPGVVGVMEIAEEHTVDPSQFDPNHPYYDPKGDPNKPKWDMVRVSFVKKFDAIVGLKELRADATAGKPLEHLPMLRQTRLSVSPVPVGLFQYILFMAGEEGFLDQRSMETEAQKMGMTADELWELNGGENHDGEYIDQVEPTEGKGEEAAKLDNGTRSPVKGPSELSSDTQVEE